MLEQRLANFSGNVLESMLGRVNQEVELKMLCRYYTTREKTYIHNFVLTKFKLYS